MISDSSDADWYQTERTQVASGVLSPVAGVTARDSHQIIAAYACHLTPQQPTAEEPPAALTHTIASQHVDAVLLSFA